MRTLYEDVRMYAYICDNISLSS